MAKGNSSLATLPAFLYKIVDSGFDLQAYDTVQAKRNEKNQAEMSDFLRGCRGFDKYLQLVRCNSRYNIFL